MSEIKVNKISPRTACGTTTLGDSGDTFTIPAGVSITNSGTASGFGATGAVSWNTTVKTSGFTAVAGEGYFVDTTSGGFTVNLPAGTAGAVVGFKDYANTFDTGNLTLDLNGSDKAGGSTGNPVLTEEGVAVTLVFIDSTKGWLVTDSGLQSEASELKTYVTATGGTILTCGNFKTHIFTGPGTFCVSCAGNAAGANEVSYVVVAGGGGAGYYYAAGGAGGYREGKTPLCTYTQSPLACTSGSNNGLPVSVQGYSIVVGAGGTASASQPCGLGASGGVSTFSTITSAGGGGGRGSACQPGVSAGPGGSGGSAGYAANTIGIGNTPPTTPPQGNNGGAAAPTSGGGGGGGAGAVGQDSPGANQPGDGGNGVALGTDFFGPTSGSYGTPGPAAGRWFAGGGSSANCGTSETNPGGAGGGGFGKGPLSAWSANAGTTNTGGGAGGGGGPYGRSGGGSGIVMIRYKFQN
tara:strand:- start:33 stop:1427 length:1395 start_codon:yes stop_codon:yes gene_type:complete